MPEPLPVALVARGQADRAAEDETYEHAGGYQPAELGFATPNNLTLAPRVGPSAD
jgi:hypothetical protein